MSSVTARIGGGLLLLAFASTPAFAQADFAGTWGARYQEDFPERIPGPELGDYLGLPINASARQFAESWDPSRITLPEEQCRVHVSPYIYRGPLNLRIWEERDPETQELVADQASASARTIKHARFTWTVVPIRRRSPPTRGWVFPPAGGKATC